MNTKATIACTAKNAVNVINAGIKAGGGIKGIQEVRKTYKDSDYGKSSAAQKIFNEKTDLLNSV